MREDVLTAVNQLRAEGRAEGRARGMRRVLLYQLHEGFGPLTPEVEERVASASEAELVAWSSRVLRAETLSDVFADRARVTAADALRAEGRAEGLVEGRRRALVVLLQGGFGSLPAEIERRVASASESELVAWTGRALRGKTLDDLFAD